MQSDSLRIQNPGKNTKTDNDDISPSLQEIEKVLPHLIPIFIRIQALESTKYHQRPVMNIYGM